MKKLFIRYENFFLNLLIAIIAFLALTPFYLKWKESDELLNQYVKKQVELSVYEIIIEALEK